MTKKCENAVLISIPWIQLQPACSSTRLMTSRNPLHHNYSFLSPPLSWGRQGSLIHRLKYSINAVKIQEHVHYELQ